jgi:hypothetical protein
MTIGEFTDIPKESTFDRTGKKAAAEQKFLAKGWAFL